MVLGKTKPHLSVTNDGEIEGTRVNAFQGKCTETGDHWAFLDEIEAPMWADLTSEAKFTYPDKDDEWFHKTHPFHQSSSRLLISLFSQSAEGPSSPKLPPSVSRSRGNHYRSKEWGQSKHHAVKNLVSKSSWASSGSSNETKPKLRSKKSNGPCLKEGSVCERSFAETSGSKYRKVSTITDSKPTSNSISNKGCESNLTSTSTTVEVSSQIFGQTSGLLSTLKISLRKSCVTRQASRVEKNVARKSEGCKYSSGKSSVGSTSNPGYGGTKNSAVKETQNKEETPESRNIKRISQAPKKIVRGTNLSEVPVNSSSRYGRVTVASKSVNQESTKAEVQRNTVRARGLGAQKFNQREPLIATKGKMQVGIGQKNNRIVDGGKENVKGKVVSSISEKYDGKEKLGGVERSSKQTVSQKNDREKTVGLKEKSNCQSEGKKRTPFVQKVYFR